MSPEELQLRELLNKALAQLYKQGPKPVKLARQLANCHLREKLQWQLASIQDDENTGYYTTCSVWRNAANDCHSFEWEFDLRCARVNLMTSTQLLNAGREYIRALRESQRVDKRPEDLTAFLAKILNQFAHEE